MNRLDLTDGELKFLKDSLKITATIKLGFSRLELNPAHVAVKARHKTEEIPVLEEDKVMNSLIDKLGIDSHFKMVREEV